MALHFARHSQLTNNATHTGSNSFVSLRPAAGTSQFVDTHGLIGRTKYRSPLTLEQFLIQEHDETHCKSPDEQNLMNHVIDHKF